MKTQNVNNIFGDMDTPQPTEQPATEVPNLLVEVTERGKKDVSLWKDIKINEFAKALGIRDNNTIPERVQLKIKFTKNELQPTKYKYTGAEGQFGERATFGALGIIAYNPDASHLIMGTEYPIGLPKNAIVGLANYINATSGDFNLAGRTFTVLNVNRQTYKWAEITEQEKLIA